jgi:hypothetical protein
MRPQVFGELLDMIGIYEVNLQPHQFPPGMREIRRIPESDGLVEVMRSRRLVSDGLFVVVMGMGVGNRIVKTGRRATLKKRYREEPEPFFHGRKGIGSIPGNTGFTQNSQFLNTGFIQE